MQEWFLHLREYKPSLNIRMAIAGRGKLGSQWEPLQNVIATVLLDVFTPQEAEAFLDVYEIRDTKRRTEILEWSGRLPVLMSWLAAPEGKEPDPLVPTSDIVERFLRWVTQSTLRQVALRAAIPHVFNVDILRPLLEHSENVDLNIDVHTAFDWLLTMPFVKQCADGWQYHEIVRRMLLQYQFQKSPQTYQKLHATMADFYDNLRKNLGLTKNEEWANTQWRNYTISYVYHFLIADPIKHWAEVMNLYVIAIRKRRVYATELIELLNSNDIYNTLTHEQQKTVHLFHQQLGAIKRGKLTDGFEMFNLLCSITDLSSQAKSYVFAFRGECYKMKDDLERAIDDFDNALNQIPDDVWILTGRGETYLRLNRYEEALADFDHTLALDEKQITAYMSRSYTFLFLDRYQEAIADLVNFIDSFAEFFPQNDSSKMLSIISEFAAVEAQICLRSRHYQEALSFLNHALALDEQNIKALTGRSKVYQHLERYEEALADLDHALALDEQNIEALVRRGKAYQQLGHDEEALADFDHALALGKSVNSTIANLRGLVLSYMGRYAEAIESYKQNLKQDSNNYSSPYNIAVTMVRWKGLTDAKDYIEEARSKLLLKIDTDERGAILYGLGGLQALANNTSQALDYLEEAIPLEKLASVWARHDIAWLDLHINPRFQILTSTTK